jgi:UDPglucose--hexose-1-phosphate uridylyltransferase
MQQLLTDPLRGEQVVLAPARALRPDAFRVAGPPPVPRDAACPFCAGNEAETPPEVARTGPGAPDTPGWRVRVVPNKYPIVGHGVRGAHEVVVLSPAHDADLGRLEAAAAAEAMLALRDRSAFHLRAGFGYVQPFVNHGRSAGASIEHPHAQLVALDGVPHAVAAIVERFASARRDLVHDDVEDAPLIARGDVAVWCPLASPSPFFVRAALLEARARFEDATDDEVCAIALALRDTVARLHAVLGEAAYNVVLRSAPPGCSGPFHWWVDVVPRLTVAAGFELGTGLSVNTVPPAEAAALLADAGHTR